MIVTGQVALILLVCMSAAYLIITTSYYATILLVITTLSVQVAMLLLYVQRTNRDLSRFLLTIEYSDFSQTFAAGSAADPLAEAFDRVMQRFRETRSAKEEHASYLNTLVQHVPIAVIATERMGRIDLFNNAARRLFGVAELRNLHDLQSFGPRFADDILRLEAGRQELITVMRSKELLQLNVSTTDLRMRGRDLKIITLQDIRRELEVRELSAWQNLIRVLTHEIMNSVTPITSLADTASELLADVLSIGALGAEDTVRDAKDAVDTIAHRGTGLIRFIESYRRLTRLPNPVLEVFSVTELFSRVRQLMTGEFERRSVKLTQSVEGKLDKLTGDSDLIEQAVINLLKNAIDAVSDATSPEVKMTAYIDASGRATIAVADNGEGMDEATREKIFVPFYTTKREGTGVGLSVVNQIMRSHHGNVDVVSVLGEGTRISLAFGTVQISVST